MDFRKILPNGFPQKKLNRFLQNCPNGFLQKNSNGFSTFLGGPEGSYCWARRAPPLQAAEKAARRAAIFLVLAKSAGRGKYAKEEFYL